MVMPCSRSARRPSVTKDRSTSRAPSARRPSDGVDLVVEELPGVEEQAADQGRLPVVDRPDGGEAQEVHGVGADLLAAVRRWAGHGHGLEVPLALSVLHRRLGEPVVAAGGAPLGNPGDRTSWMMSSMVVGLRRTAPVQGGVPDRAEPHRGLLGHLPGPGVTHSLTASSSRPARSPDVGGRSRSTAARSAPGAMYCQMSSSVKSERGKARRRSPGRTLPW